MDDCSAVSDTENHGSSIHLKGTSKGFEIQIESGFALTNVATDIQTKLDEAPGFFKGGDVILRFNEVPPKGYLGVIEEVTDRYELQIVGVHGPAKPQLAVSDGQVQPVVASGSNKVETQSAPTGKETPAISSVTPTSEPSGIESRLREGALPPKMVVGPVRSGSILEFSGHLIVLGDINPGAEVRASGSIVVLGRLRGIAHAGCTGGSGFILALQMEPQQLRIGSIVARPGDSDESSEKAEIAYVKDGGMIVDHYKGRVPFGIETAKF